MRFCPDSNNHSWHLSYPRQVIWHPSDSLCAILKNKAVLKKWLGFKSRIAEARFRLLIIVAYWSLFDHK